MGRAGLCKDGKMVLIDWLDSKGAGSLWEHLDEIESMPPDRIRSVGIVIEEIHEYITVVQSLGTTQVLGRLTIPRCAIQRLVELEAGRDICSARNLDVDDK